MRKFLISGCGRSGTTYTAKLLTAAGCSCSHEAYFPKKVTALIYLPLFYECIYTPYRKVFKLQYPISHQGEAAWHAAPFLDFLHDDTVVFHQIRNPIDFIRSRQKIGLIGTGRLRRDGRLRGKFTSISYRDIKNFRNLSMQEQVDHLARVWIEWNEIVEEKCKNHVNFRYRLEDIDVSLVEKIFSLIEFDYDLDKLKLACESVSKKTNSRGKTRSDVSLDMLSKPLYSRVKDLASRYGYNEL